MGLQHLDGGRGPPHALQREGEGGARHLPRGASSEHAATKTWGSGGPGHLGRTGAPDTPTAQEGGRGPLPPSPPPGAPCSQLRVSTCRVRQGRAFRTWRTGQDRTAGHCQAGREGVGQALRRLRHRRSAVPTGRWPGWCRGAKPGRTPLPRPYIPSPLPGPPPTSNRPLFLPRNARSPPEPHLSQVRPTDPESSAVPTQHMSLGQQALWCSG